MRILFVVVAIFSLSSLSAQQLFEKLELRKQTNDAALKAATTLRLNQNIYHNLLQSKPQQLTLGFPVGGEVLQYELTKSDIFTEDFTAVMASDFRELHSTGGYFLQGKPANGSKGFLALSFFDNEIIAVLNDGKTSYSIGKAKGLAADEYLMVDDNDVAKSMLPRCFSEDIAQPNSNHTYEAPRSGTGCVIDVYVEAAYQLYLARGSSVASTINYVAGIFNINNAIYKNEDIDVQIREIKVWDTVDPEDALTSTSTVLNSFRTRMNSGFNGDLAHYVTSKGLGGGIAYLNVLGSSAGFRTGVSGNLNASSIPEFPTFSFTAMVIAHELGHNIGSNHTQWCGWAGGAIDNCYTTEGGCPAGPAPVGGGTIMSYCHLTGYGINLNNGFGPLPGALIRTRAAASTAICNCNNIFASIEKSDQGCGLTNNGAARVNIEGGTGPFTYLWSTGATTNEVTGLAPGDYYVTITSATTGCTVIKGVKIKAGATAIAVPRTPAQLSATECNGSNIVLAVNPIGGSGTYTYQWFNGATLLAGETNNTYSVTATGSYYAQVTSGTCVSNSSTFAATFVPTPTPVLSANRTFPICSADNATYTITPSTGFFVEWYRNGTLISGATAANYTSNLAGTYTAQLRTLGNCTALSNPINAIINPTPTVTTVPNRLTLICPGQTITMTATSSEAGSNFQWYFNSSAIAGATTSSYLITAVGSYYVQVTSPVGCSAQSSSVFFEVNSKVPFSVVNGPLTFCDGDSVKLKVQITSTSQGGSTGPLSEVYNYQWFRNGTPIAGAIYDSIFAKLSGTYVVRVGSDRRCDSTKTDINVVVHPKPIPSVLSSLGWVILGGSTTVLSTIASYSGYQWYRNGTILAGETMSTLSTGFGGNYSVVVIDSNGCSGPSIGHLLVVNSILSNTDYHLKGSVVGNLHKLNWGRIPNAITVLQRSIDGRSFEDIYKDNSNSFSLEAKTKKVWYRLKVINNGNSKFSNLVLLQTGIDKGLTVFPNPVQKTLQVITSESCGTIRLVDKLGRTVASHIVQSTNESIDVSALKPGIYSIVQYCNSKVVAKQLFIKE